MYQLERLFITEWDEMIIFSNLQIMWKKAVITYIKILAKYSPGATK